MQIPNGSVWPCLDGRRKKSKTKEDGSYQMAQVGHGDGQKRKRKTGEDGSYHTARLALETEEERRAKNGLDLSWIEIGFLKIKGMILLAL